LPPPRAPLPRRPACSASCLHRACMSSHNAAPSCVLVVVAMDVELQAVLRLPLERRQSCGEASEGGNPSIFHQFADGERTVWVVQSGIGPVMGALAAQEAVLSLAPRPELVLSLGVGGALAASLAPGDLVLAARVVKHDTRCGGALMRPGELWLSDPHRHERDPGFDAPAVRDAPLTHSAMHRPEAQEASTIRITSLLCPTRAAAGRARVRARRAARRARGLQGRDAPLGRRVCHRGAQGRPRRLRRRRRPDGGHGGGRHRAGRHPAFAAVGGAADDGRPAPPRCR